MSPKSMLFVVILVTVQGSLNGNMLNSLKHRQNIPNIHQKLGKILNSCYTSSLNTLVASDDLSEVTRAVSEHTLVNVFLIDENFDSRQRHGFFPRWPMFLLSANSETALTAMLQCLRSSDFWKASSTFIIVGSPGGGCDSASDILHAMWKMDLLTTFYFCEQSEGVLLLYTFNPFTNLAPRPWKKVQTDLDKRWTLYSRPYSDDLKICKNLDFEKTKSLKRYPVTVIAETSLSSSKLGDGRNDDLDFADAMTLNDIWSRMKIKPAINYTDPREIVNGKPADIGVGVMNGSYDMAGMTRYIRPNYSTFTYPFVASNVAILTKHRNFLNPVEKIINFYSLGAIFLIGAVFLITWFIFVIGKDGPLSSAALEVLRLILSTGVLRPLRGIPLRIYLFGIWWLVIILNATFQGHMGSFLTKPERHAIETLENLKHYNYHIYVNSFYHTLLSECWKEFPEDRIHLIEEVHCYPYVLNNTAAACIQNIGELYEPAMEHNLYVSRPLSFSPYITFLYRADWPLAERVNTYMSRLATSGILDHWKQVVDDDPLKEIHAREAQATAPQVRKIRLDDLTFAFALLAIGLVVAGICLLGEIRNGAKKKKSPQPLFLKRTRLPHQVLKQKNTVGISIQDEVQC